MEDSVTLGVCFQRGGKDNVSVAIRIYKHIHYERVRRVRRVQKTGESTSHTWYEADWDAFNKDPTKIQLPRNMILVILQTIILIDLQRRLDSVGR